MGHKVTQVENMNVNKIILDNIATPSVRDGQKEIVIDSYMSLIRYVRFKSNESHSTKIEEYISKIHIEMNLQHLKQELLRKTKKKVPFESKAQSNENIIISLTPCVHKKQYVLLLFYFRGR